MSYFEASEGALETGAAVVARKRSISRFAALTLAALSRRLLGTSSMVALGLVLATSTPSRAIDWTGGTSTDWFTATNWSAGVPTSAVDANIDTVAPNATVVGAAGAQARSVFVGFTGTGKLTIRNGGTMSNAGSGYFGYGFGAGTVTVDGAGSALTNSSDLYVGYFGAGTLTIRNGGTVSNANIGYLGFVAGSTGTATVDGAGSAWTSSSTLVVGYSGTGTLTIQNGGKASNVGHAFLGNNAGSTGTLTVDGAGSSWTNSGVLVVGESGTGTLTIANGGAVSPASGMQIARQAGSTGTLNIGAAAGQTAAAPGTLTTPSIAFGAGTGRIVFNHTASNYNFAPTISGAGSVTVENGTTMLTATNTYSGPTTVNGGVLQLGNGGTTGSLLGNVLNNATLGFNRSNAYQFDGAISGTGGVQQNGVGTTTLTAANTYSGATTINAGTLRGAAANTFSATSATTINTGGTLDLGLLGQTINIVSLSGGTLADGALTGAVTSSGGTLNSLGGGMTLTANSGATNVTGTNTFTGATTVNGGLLSVNGTSTASAVTVNAGGTLGGNGTVGNTTINGGTLAPGNSIGTLTVQGNLVLTAASSYMVEVSPSAADRTNVTGVATFGGATVKASFTAGAYVAKQYTILNATGGIGTSRFGSIVNTNLPGGFASSLSYDTNNAYLNLALSFVPPPGTSLNNNQRNIADSIVNFFNTNGGIPLAFGGLTPAGLAQISGETATGSQQTTFNAMNQFMAVMTDPFIDGRGDGVSAGSSAGASAYASPDMPRSGAARDAYAMFTKAAVIADPFAQRWSVWAAGYGGSQTTDGNTTLGSNNTTSRIAGTAVGADYRISPNTLAGFALAGGGTSFSVVNGGSGRSDLFQAGAFIRHNAGAAYISGALAYGWQDITTNRTVTVAGIDQLRAQFNANAFSGRVEGGYRFVSPWMGGIGITPYAAGQFTTFDLPAYAEQAVTGVNTFALAYASKSVTDTRSELGLRSDKSYAMADGIFTLRGRLAWAHDFNPGRNIGATFQTLPGASFVVGGAAQASDSALVTTSVEKKWLNGWSAAATFEGEFSQLTTSYAGKGVVRYSW